LCNQKLLGLIAQLPVLGISRFLPGEQVRILSVQLFYLRKFLYPQFIKGLFGCLVQRQFFTVRFEELFAVAGFPIGFIGRTRFR
jgi:hypothetical protein